ncbi:hypothetical protein D3C71_1927770 [compost metagenome]
MGALQHVVRRLGRPGDAHHVFGDAVPMAGVGLGQLVALHIQRPARLGHGVRAAHTGRDVHRNLPRGRRAAAMADLEGRLVAGACRGDLVFEHHMGRCRAKKASGAYQ